MLTECIDPSVVVAEICYAAEGGFVFLLLNSLASTPLQTSFSLIRTHPENHLIPHNPLHFNLLAPATLDAGFGDSDSEAFAGHGALLSTHLLAHQPPYTSQICICKRKGSLTVIIFVKNTHPSPDPGGCSTTPPNDHSVMR